PYPTNTKINNHNSYPIEPLNLLTIIIDVITILITIITPPIVGVPVFFICDFGPSSLMLCPNFKRLKKGINIGDKRTVIKNAIPIVMIKPYIFTTISSLVQQPSILLMMAD